MEKIAFIRSGGQTGADRGALDAAIGLGIPIKGWVPNEGWAEDMPESPGLLSIYPSLSDSGSPDPAVRTRMNARDSHANLVIDSGSSHSPGTDLTVAMASHYRRPHLVTDGSDVDTVLAWIDSLPMGITLNVAGPCESESPGIYETSYNLVTRILEHASKG